MKEKVYSMISYIVFWEVHNNLSVYSLNSRAGRIWKRIGFAMDCEGNGILGSLAGRFWKFEVWADFGKSTHRQRSWVHIPEIGSLDWVFVLKAILEVWACFRKRVSERTEIGSLLEGWMDQKVCMRLWKRHIRLLEKEPLGILVEG